MPPRSVFASSGGDLGIVDRICCALGEPDRPVSPTHFHNSVHNAPAGYWAIGAGCRAGSLSLSGYDGSFAAGLLEAAALVASGDAPVLLVAYDTLPPASFAAARPIGAAFGVALALVPPGHEAGPVIARLHIGLVAADDGADGDPLADAALEALRLANPAARALPLLAAIARGAPATVRLPYIARRRLLARIEP
jgi:hypothetical protein